MKKELGIKNVRNLANKASFKIRKYSPEILATVGIIGTVASAVMACRATTKIGAILDEANETIDTIHLKSLLFL